MGNCGALPDALCTRGTEPVPRNAHKLSNELEEEEEQDGKEREN